MQRPTLLEGDNRKSSLAEISSWSEVEGRNAIKRKFVFKDFAEAFSWMTRIAILADKMDHHPEWFNVYKTVDVVLATHDCGGVSILDIKLAKKMDEYFHSMGH